MAGRYDYFLDEYRIKDNPPEVTSDPVSPKQTDPWVLKTQSAGTTGVKILNFLGLGFPYFGPGAGSFVRYQFSYYTTENSTQRVTLS